MYDFTIIGIGHLDVLARPVSPRVFETGSYPAEMTKLTIGGDAINETTVLTKLGKKVNFVSKIGRDLAGEIVLSHCRQNGISTERIKIQDGLDTSVNLVLVEENGERSFVTNRNGSLRKLKPEDIDPAALNEAKILCFASIFVYPDFTPAALEALFSAAKAAGCTVCADMTKRKNRETVEDLRGALRYVDYLFPNYEEAAMVTGKTDIREIADAFLDCGVGCIVIKTGSRGCVIKTKDAYYEIPAVPGVNCVDTTGAGDNFAAGFLYALSENMSLLDCGKFANATASIAVEHMGATGAVTSVEQIKARLARMK